MSQESTRIIYMGTPEFAVAPLKAIIDHGYNVVAVITAPDKPAGRGKKLQSPAVKDFALSLPKPLKVLQPEKLKDPEFLASLKELKPDLQVVVAFRMLPSEVWSLPKLGTFNLHASLLPQYRGAAPINHAIINGETESGLTTFFIDEKIDTGKILFQEKVPIPKNYSAGDLHDKLMETGSELVLRTISSIISGDWKETPQDSLIDPTIPLKPAPKIFKEDCRINWTLSGIQIQNFIRGLSPEPTAITFLKGNDAETQVKIFKSSFVPGTHQNKPGMITIPDRKTILVSCSDGYISIHSLQFSGKKQLDVLNLLNGFKFQAFNYFE